MKLNLDDLNNLDVCSEPIYGSEEIELPHIKVTGTAKIKINIYEMAKILNEQYPYRKMNGLDLKYYFVFKGKMFLVSTVDLFHGGKPLIENYPCRYETLIFKDVKTNGDFGREIYGEAYETEEEARQRHDEIKQELFSGTADYFYRALEVSRLEEEE